MERNSRRRNFRGTVFNGRLFDVHPETVIREGEFFPSDSARHYSKEVIKMLDLIFIGAIVGFFLASLAYVGGCESLRGNKQ